MPSGGNFTACGCGPDTTVCESPTQPVATVGLCLADGSPIAVTVVRDCAGAVTSEGWLDLTTGAWSAGPPPVGTIACGNARSVQVSGTFCDVDPDGDVLGLVLVEYAYAADGSISGVRLVDAVTGETYTPAGTVTTCPAGVEQPERDIVQLCDVAEDGTSTPYVRDYVRDQTGAITGHTDYTLDGEPYTPTGSVGLCAQDCTDCQAHVLCDLLGGADASPLVATGTSTSTQKSGTLENGVSWTSNANRASGDPAGWWTVSLFPLPTVGPVTITFDHPVAATWSAQVGRQGTVSGAGLVMPEGTVPVEIHPLHSWDPATRTLAPLAAATVTDPSIVSRFAHPGPVTSLAFGGIAGGLASLRRFGDLQVTPLPTTFLRTVCTSCEGEHQSTTDTLLDGATAFIPAGEVGVCGPKGQQEQEPCASAVTTLRLCDLDPNAAPDETGKRCATPYLRHLVYDCAGAITEARDTATDGVTPYTPVQPVDCGSGGVPAMVEVPWEIVGIEQDPASPAGRGFLYSLSPIDDPDTVGVVKVTTTSTANTSCANTPPNYSFANPTTFTFQPDQVLQDHATYVRCDLLDFDTFEPVTALTPPPSRLGGTAYWDGTTVRPTVSNGVGEMYYDGPPAQWSYRVGNTGGGLSCSSLSFAAISLRPEGCCAPCGEGSGGDSGRTVQEVCVISNAAPTVVMTWTRVIEDGGATIYYLDQAGARYDNTLPAAHQIVACPAEEPEPCLNSTTVLLCDTEEDQTEPVPTEGEPTVTDLVPPAPLESAHVALEGGGASLWSGGSLVFPADATGSQVYRTVAATLTAPRPSCDDGTVTVTASVHVHLDGPTGTGGYGGALRLFDGTGTMVAEQGPPSSAPPGYDAVLTVTGDVPAADLAAGAVTVWLALETQQAGPKAWTTDNFEVSHVFNAPAEPCAEPVPVQFFRTLVTDCATGEVVSTSDTTLDGQPYTVAGEVGQCTAVGGGETEPDTCVHCETLTLCDVQPDESPGEPEIAYETIPLADLGPAGSYGDGSPVTGTLPNGVGYSVNVGEWGPGQGHYTFYPYDGTQLWTFTEPVYLRFGLRGLNITPTECYVIPEGAVAESISANHTWDPDSRLLCEITGQSSATDESTFLLGPVTELPIVPSGSSTGGRGPGLIEVGLPVEAPAPGSSTTFLRVVCRDCSGAVTSVTDTTLDGEPYEVLGEVGQCVTADGGCCEQPPPELRVDVESHVMCIQDAAGEITGQVLVERVYDDQGGERLEQRLTDLTAGDPVELPAGAELVLCQEPPCPTAFSTECVGVVERSEASYDNTSLIGGVPGQCGGVQGPGGQFPCQPTTGGLTITSWIVNGEEVIGDGGRNFAGGPCGPGTAGSPGMHANWSAALTNLDPTGATWSAQTEPACAWFVGSTGGTSTTYGPMVVEDAAGQQWTLTPAQSCRETQFTKVYSQECNGGVSVSWLDADGVETDAPEGQQVPCGTGCGSGGGRGLDVEPVLLCDVAEDGTSTTFLRHLSYGAAGQVAGALDTALDGFTPYTPTGTVGRCQPDPGEGRDVELVPMCVVDNATGGVVARILAEATYDSASGERLSVTYVDPLTWGPVPLPGGTHVALCPDPEPGPDVELLPLCDVAADGTVTPFLRHLLYPVGATAPTVLDTGLDGVTPYTVTGEVDTCPAEEECPSRNVLTACRWDDTDGDGIADTEYVELLAVDCEGALTSVGTFLPDLSDPYTPVSPVDGSTADPGPEPAVTVQAHRVQLAPGGTWDAASVAALRSVTMTAHSGTGELTTADGVSSLFPGESVTWSVDKDVDAALVGPLTVTAGAGPVTVTWTRAV